MKKHKTIKPTRIVTFGEGGMDIQLEEEHLCKCGEEKKWVVSEYVCPDCGGNKGNRDFDVS